MIIFVSGNKDVKEAMSKNKKGVFIGATSDLDIKGLDEGRFLLPPPDILTHYQMDGDKRSYETEYHRYLSEPRVNFMLLLLVYRSITENVFIVCSEMEKDDMRYLKFLKNYINDAFAIDKKYTVSYKKFDGKRKKYDEITISKITNIAMEAKGKAAEAADVLG